MNKKIFFLLFFSCFLVTPLFIHTMENEGVDNYAKNETNDSDTDSDSDDEETESAPNDNDSDKAPSTTTSDDNDAFFSPEEQAAEQQLIQQDEDSDTSNNITENNFLTQDEVGVTSIDDKPSDSKWDPISALSNLLWGPQTSTTTEVEAISSSEEQQARPLTAEQQKTSDNAAVAATSPEQRQRIYEKAKEDIDQDLKTPRKNLLQTDLDKMPKPTKQEEQQLEYGEPQYITWEQVQQKQTAEQSDQPVFTDPSQIMTDEERELMQNLDRTLPLEESAKMLAGLGAGAVVAFGTRNPQIASRIITAIEAGDLSQAAEQAGLDKVSRILKTLETKPVAYPKHVAEKMKTDYQQPAQTKGPKPDQSKPMTETEETMPTRRQQPLSEEPPLDKYDRLIQAHEERQSKTMQKEQEHHAQNIKTLTKDTSQQATQDLFAELKTKKKTSPKPFTQATLAPQTAGTMRRTGAYDHLLPKTTSTTTPTQYTSRAWGSTRAHQQEFSKKMSERALEQHLKGEQLAQKLTKRSMPQQPITIQRADPTQQQIAAAAQKTSPTINAADIEIFLTQPLKDALKNNNTHNALQHLEKAHRQHALKWHPDKHEKHLRTEATKTFQNIEAVYNQLRESIESGNPQTIQAVTQGDPLQVAQALSNAKTLAPQELLEAQKDAYINIFLTNTLKNELNLNNTHNALQHLNYTYKNYYKKFPLNKHDKHLSAEATKISQNFKTVYDQLKESIKSGNPQTIRAITQGDPSQVAQALSNVKTLTPIYGQPPAIIDTPIKTTTQAPNLALLQQQEQHVQQQAQKLLKFKKSDQAPLQLPEPAQPPMIIDLPTETKIQAPDFALSQQQELHAQQQAQEFLKLKPKTQTPLLLSEPAQPEISTPELRQQDAQIFFSKNRHRFIDNDNQLISLNNVAEHFNVDPTKLKVLFKEEIHAPRGPYKLSTKPSLPPDELIPLTEVSSLRSIVAPSEKNLQLLAELELAAEQQLQNQAFARQQAQSRQAELDQLRLDQAAAQRQLEARQAATLQRAEQEEARKLLQFAQDAQQTQPTTLTGLTATSSTPATPKQEHVQLFITPEFQQHLQKKDYDAALKILNKTYKTNALIFHPDKLSNEPQEVQDLGTKLFQELASAHDTIKSIIESRDQSMLPTLARGKVPQITDALAQQYAIDPAQATSAITQSSSTQPKTIAHEGQIYPDQVEWFPAPHQTTSLALDEPIVTTTVPLNEPSAFIQQQDQNLHQLTQDIQQPLKQIDTEILTNVKQIPSSQTQSTSKAIKPSEPVSDKAIITTTSSKKPATEAPPENPTDRPQKLSISPPKTLLSFAKQLNEKEKSTKTQDSSVQKHKPAKKGEPQFDKTPQPKIAFQDALPSPKDSTKQLNEKEKSNKTQDSSVQEHKPAPKGKAQSDKKTEPKINLTTGQTLPQTSQEPLEQQPILAKFIEKQPILEQPKAKAKQKLYDDSDQSISDQEDTTQPLIAQQNIKKTPTITKRTDTKNTDRKKHHDSDTRPSKSMLPMNEKQSIPRFDSTPMTQSSSPSAESYRPSYDHPGPSPQPNTAGTTIPLTDRSSIGLPLASEPFTAQPSLAKFDKETLQQEMISERSKQMMPDTRKHKKRKLKQDDIILELPSSIPTAPEFIPFEITQPQAAQQLQQLKSDSWKNPFDDIDFEPKEAKQELQEEPQEEQSFWTKIVNAVKKVIKQISNALFT